MYSHSDTMTSTFVDSDTNIAHLNCLVVLYNNLFMYFVAVRMT